VKCKDEYLARTKQEEKDGNDNSSSPTLERADDGTGGQPITALSA
jgi:hypothetical protein